MEVWGYLMFYFLHRYAIQSVLAQSYHDWFQNITMVVNAKKMLMRHVFCLLSVTLVSGQGLFRKHFEQKLDTHLSAEIPVNGVFECEKECLRRPDLCDAANVIHVKGNRYDCNLIKSLPNDGVTNHLSPNPRGKLIIRQG